VHAVANQDLDPATNSDKTSATDGCGARCPTNETLTLNWDANADIEVLQGYRIYAVDTASSNTLLSDISINDTSFSKNLPSISYQIQSGLQLLAGDRACFKVEAYNAIGTHHCLMRCASPSTNNACWQRNTNENLYPLFCPS